jgi:hypothetical protein
MEKILLAFLISLFLSSLGSLLLIAVGVKLISAIFIGLLASDVILIIIYFPDMINSTNTSDLIYILGYVIVTVFIGVIYAVYTFVTDTTKKCVCKCCRKVDYENLG